MIAGALLAGWLSLQVQAQESGADALGRGDEEAALHLFEAEVAARPGDAVVLQQFAYLLYRRGELARADALFQRSLELGGDAAYAELMRGVIAELGFDLGTAERHYRRCLVLAPDHAVAAANLAQLELLRRDRARFARAYARAGRDRFLAAGGLGLFAGALLLGARRPRR